MKTQFLKLVGAASIALGTMAAPVFADVSSSFADDASAKSLAEIQTSRVALDKAHSADVKVYAQKIIDDNTQANRELAAVASNAKVSLSDDAALLDKAKKLVLEQRDGKDFDAAYAKNQISAHEKTIALFQDYLKDGDNNYLKAYAKETLPKLQHNLELAKELHAKHPDK